MHLIIFGRGQFAQLIDSELRKKLPEYKGVTHNLVNDLPLPSIDPSHGKPIVVHIGSGTKLWALIRECNGLGYPIIQGSTGIPSVAVPVTLRIPVIEAPNFGLNIVALFDVLPRFGKHMREQDAKVKITVSHQLSKKSTPGTAYKVAGFFGIDKKDVVVLDTIEKQRAFGVPEEHLGAHAYHKIEVELDGVKSEIWTKVHGRKPYVRGLLRIAALIKLFEHYDIAPGVHSIEKFMFDNPLLV